MVHQLIITIRIIITVIMRFRFSDICVNAVAILKQLKTVLQELSQIRKLSAVTTL
jgi:hypothetical protein